MPGILPDDGPYPAAVDFEFTQRRPTGRLGRYVESVWHARGQIPYVREKIAPTGSTVAGIVLGPPIRQTPTGGPPFLATTGFLIGPHDPAAGERADDAVVWSRLAADLGWYDQAHLIRDVTRHTGVPPTAYVWAQRRYLAPDEQAPGFVPEG
jgi:hypothetical protein